MVRNAAITMEEQLEVICDKDSSEYKEIVELEKE